MTTSSLVADMVDVGVNVTQGKSSRGEQDLRTTGSKAIRLTNLQIFHNWSFLSYGSFAAFWFFCFSLSRLS
jgi:hypothetical protein